MREPIGCTVMGCHLFGLAGGWEGQPPAGDHVVVMSYRPTNPVAFSVIGGPAE